jgi:hypothetical protein
MPKFRNNGNGTVKKTWRAGLYPLRMLPVHAFGNGPNSGKMGIADNPKKITGYDKTVQGRLQGRAGLRCLLPAWVAVVLPSLSWMHLRLQCCG